MLLCVLVCALVCSCVFLCVLLCVFLCVLLCALVCSWVVLVCAKANFGWFVYLLFVDYNCDTCNPLPLLPLSLLPMVLGYCTPTQFRCYYWSCISATLVCDGVINCPTYWYYNDYSDESGCAISRSPVPILNLTPELLAICLLLFNPFQTAQTLVFVWWVGSPNWRGGWRCATTTSGVQCAMIDGTQPMP